MTDASAGRLARATTDTSHVGWVASGDSAPLPLIGVAIDRPSVVLPGGFDASGRPWPLFAHGSEAEMARILDFYGVRWDYEPRTFPILWNLEGDVIESFSPDFHLPDMELYLELTTLKQRLVRKKNRKIRRLRELYPDLRVKLFYARDFRAIMLKYGRLALADSMSGTLGQVAPERPGDRQAAAAARTTGVTEALVGDIEEQATGPDEAGDDGSESAADSSSIASLPGRSGRSRSRSRRRRAAAAARSNATDPATHPIAPGSAALGAHVQLHHLEEGSGPR
ncbi:MAG: hypothetical protein ABIV26_00735 [Candidatus Limnocylindrales bacterium]